MVIKWVFRGLHAKKGVLPYNKRTENTQYTIIKNKYIKYK